MDCRVGPFGSCKLDRLNLTLSPTHTEEFSQRPLARWRCGSSIANYHGGKSYTPPCVCTGPRLPSPAAVPAARFISKRGMKV